MTAAAAGASRSPTIASYFRSFAPVPEWDAIVGWPPDVFALASLVLDHTEAYQVAVAPPASFRWPPGTAWSERVTATATEWRAAAAASPARTPRAVLEHFDVVSRRRDTPLVALRGGADTDLSAALLTLHAVADETARDLGTAPRGAFEQQAMAALEAHGSLARLSPARIRVLPKTRLPARGLTIRSFSRYLALSYEAVEVEWQQLGHPSRAVPADRTFNVVLLPWPLRVDAGDFRPIAGPIDNMDAAAFGFFEFAPPDRLPHEVLAGVLEAARRHQPRVDVVILPEAAVDESELPGIEAVLGQHGVVSLIAGVREPPRRGRFGGNRLHIAVRAGEAWRQIAQAKHHRWCLDGPQIRQYHLSRALDPRRQWWEAIDLPERRVEILDAGRGMTVAPLICEDLARIDEVADVLRRVGPTLVVALLLDGPQLRTRWPCRYASIIAEDPGSAVLTVTSLGMAERSRPSGARRSRVVASWTDPATGVRELELGRRSRALLVTASVGDTTVWTADGRRHDTTAELSLSAVEQLAPSTGARRQ